MLPAASDSKNSTQDHPRPFQRRLTELRENLRSVCSRSKDTQTEHDTWVKCRQLFWHNVSIDRCFYNLKLSFIEYPLDSARKALTRP